jgi:Holliday junction resolvase-like predicted endonuclease
MTATTDIIIALLNKTSDCYTAVKGIAHEANVAVQVANNILSSFREKGLIECENELIELSSNQRVQLAIHAINNGTDVERVCKVLEWKEFENFTAKAFEENNFAVKRNFRFKGAQRRWEIDVVAYNDPIIVCVDCKRWRRGWGNSAITKIATAQARRTQVLAKNLQNFQHNIGLSNWKRATLFPVILSLFPGCLKFYNNVPVVPILQLQNFVDEFQGYQDELLHYEANMGTKLPDFS